MNCFAYIELRTKTLLLLLFAVTFGPFVCMRFVIIITQREKWREKNYNALRKIRVLKTNEYGYIYIYWQRAHIIHKHNFIFPRTVCYTFFSFFINTYVQN